MKCPNSMTGDGGLPSPGLCQAAFVLFTFTCTWTAFLKCVLIYNPISARGPHEHAALQPAMSSRELPDEILLLSWVVLASGSFCNILHCVSLMESQCFWITLQRDKNNVMYLITALLHSRRWKWENSWICPSKNVSLWLFLSHYW